METAKVWLVYQEYQADTPDIVGLYLSRQDAERVAEECREEAREEYGWVVYGDRNEQGEKLADWDVDVHVEAHDVEGASDQSLEEKPARHTAMRSEFADCSSRKAGGRRT